MNEDYQRNHYAFVSSDPTGLRYRLEGDDVIQAVVSILRGGLVQEKDGSLRHNEQYRLMNEEGIARVELFLRGGVNKINHLTKYKNEERIMRQMRALVRAFTIELVENLKRWAPGVYEVNGELINPEYRKVRNKHIVLQVVENALFQSMQRGQEGFEAELTGKSWMVQETVGQRETEKPRMMGLRGLFNRGEGGNNYG